MKNIIKNIAIAGTALGVLSFAAPAMGATSEWCFYGAQDCTDAAINTGNTDVGLDETYIDHLLGNSVEVKAFVALSQNDVTRTLIENKRGIHAVGLGINGGTSTGELDEKGLQEQIQIDLGVDYLKYSNLMMRMSSVEGPETYAIFTADTGLEGGLPWTIVEITPGANNLHNTYFGLSGVKRYLFIVEDHIGSASESSILLTSLKADVVPAPAMLGLMGLSLVGLGFAAAKRRK